MRGGMTSQVAQVKKSLNAICTISTLFVVTGLRTSSTYLKPDAELGVDSYRAVLTGNQRSHFPVAHLSAEFGWFNDQGGVA